MSRRAKRALPDLPEVMIERHTAISAVNTAWSEAWNAWLDVLNPKMKSMDGSALAVYLWLLVDLWNMQVISAHPAAPPVQLPGPRAGRLKRPSGS